MEKQPQDFYGNWEKADNFIEEVKGYLHLNQDVSRFNSLKKKAAFTLACMKGPKVAGWVRDMGRIIDQLGPNDNAPIFWEQFLWEFEMQFQDSLREDRAWTKITKLRMKNGKIDAYIAKFEELARKARYMAGNPKTLWQFHMGLPQQVLEDVMHSPPVVGYDAHKQQAIESVLANRVIWDIQNSKSNFGGWNQGNNPFQGACNYNYQLQWLSFFQQNPRNNTNRSTYNSSNACYALGFILLYMFIFFSIFPCMCTTSLLYHYYWTTSAVAAISILSSYVLMHCFLYHLPLMASFPTLPHTSSFSSSVSHL
jgi:hypothetical protein